MLSAKIAREFINSGISSSSIDSSRPSRDHVDHLIVNFHVRILVQVHYVVIVSLSLFKVARTYLYARWLCF